MPWRISPWFSIVHSYLLALSCLILHSFSLASAFICFVKGEVRQVSQDWGLKVVNIPAVLRNTVLSHYFQEFDLFIPLNRIRPRLSQSCDWRFSILLLPLDCKNLSAKRTPDQMTLCNKMDDSLEMGPHPPNVSGGNSLPKKSNEILLFINHLSCESCIISPQIHLVNRWFKCHGIWTLNCSLFIV